jgi:CspA family cold shock protein
MVESMPRPTLNAGPLSELRKDTMPTGSVKWYDPKKGYGFIQPDDGSKDVFVHVSAVEASGLGRLNDNQRVSFEIERGKNGKVSAVQLKAVT